MPDDKKYFWLKLPKDFFTKHYILMLLSKDEESQDKGKMLVLFYIRLLTESIDHEGRLRYSDSRPYTDKSLSELTGFPLQFVTEALRIFTELELIVTEEDNTIFLPKSLKMIGSEGTSAERVRRFRNRKKDIEELDESLNNPQSNANVTKCNDDVTEPESKPKAPDKHSEDAKEIIDYLNLCANTHYKSSSQKTKSCINARFKDGFTIDDFKMVIDKKSAEWKSTDMEKYLRPETLFGTKFESYLNQNIMESNHKHSGGRGPIDWQNV